MRSESLIARAVALLLALIALPLQAGGTSPDTPTAPPLQTGDIVLTGNDGAWAFLARRFAEHDPRWSHVGMVVRDGDDLEVVHMDGSPLGGHIRREPLARFTGQAQLSRLVRPALNDGQRRQLRAWLDGHLARNTAFDTRFRLDDRPAMYCSELVWRGLRRVGGLPAGWELPTVGGRAFVPVDRLVELDASGRSAARSVPRADHLSAR
ncbi:hypothetical protein LV475_01920 [Guyparkeria hydrothermalis]|uniref:YiiX/YebB-like N1pC/P60 family cysteine hydrolase n=1 Tax=Guyparkeria TaxID=2035712 RepID=UPI0018CC00F0|nr:YiiX/YebB-like N1pC/P60 family cysteine hydrolase [Guyparkeria halophila]MCL7750361.1 hypothetical protein [Guyparkeria hydrothermalis]